MDYCVKFVLNILDNNHLEKISLLFGIRANPSPGVFTGPKCTAEDHERAAARAHETDVDGFTIVVDGVLADTLVARTGRNVYCCGRCGADGRTEVQCFL